MTYDEPLPVELLNFSSKLISKNQAQLSWQTASESNNLGFEVQRSIDGREWEKLGFVAGKGTTNNLNDYQFWDTYPFGGINYYRLKQVDFDGAFEYSNVISVDLLKVDNIQLYPNPTSGQINVFGLESGKVRVLNGIGNLVKEVAFYEPEIDISELPSGVYFIQITSDDHKVFAQRIFKE